MAIYDDLDSFLDNPSALTVKDIVEDYKELLKLALTSSKEQGSRYFIDEESKTLFGAICHDGKLNVFRLEQEGHRFTRGLLRKIIKFSRQAKEETGLPIEVRTKECFYNDKARKLLKLTLFKTVAFKDGYYISIFKG